MNILGRLESVDSFVDWCEIYKDKLVKDYYQNSSNRRILDLTETTDLRLLKLIERFVERRNIRQILLNYYPKNSKLGLHRDKGRHQTAYSLSSTDFSFIYDGKEYECKKGNIHRFNGKLEHGIKGYIKEPRWCLCWWESRNPEQLSLF